MFVATHLLVVCHSKSSAMLLVLRDTFHDKSYLERKMRSASAADFYDENMDSALTISPIGQTHGIKIRRTTGPKSSVDRDP